MPLARAFTKRLRSDSQVPILGRAFSPREEKKNRPDISLPITLLSTTNMLSYDAPDVETARMALAKGSVPAMISSRSSSDDDAHAPSTPTEPTLTDASSVDSSPAIEYNHLSCYFPGPAVKRSQSARSAAAQHNVVPAIPQRASSHSKREHERLARKRSLRSSRSPPSSEPASPAPERSSFDIIGNSDSKAQESPSGTSSPQPHGHHPFSLELEQLNEVAEEFQSVTQTLEEQEDMAVMSALGLERFSVFDYITEIGFLFPSAEFEAGLVKKDNKLGWI